MSGGTKDTRRTMIKRRLYVEERRSPLARWSLRLALFSAPVLILAAALYRARILEFKPAAAAFGAGLAIAALAALMAAVAFFRIWESGWRGMGQAIGAFALSLALLVGPAAILARAALLPRLTDITTDTADPPKYHALAFARPRFANTLAYPGGDAPREQRLAYPGVKPIDLDATPEEAFNAVLSVVQRRRWRVIDATPPRGNLRDGRIEAVAVTPVLGFRNDVVIRVRPTTRGARVDVRSLSRYAVHDLGENAARISGLVSDISTERRRRQ